jgi:mono/diheme cytochrome c family protein
MKYRVPSARVLAVSCVLWGFCAHGASFKEAVEADWQRQDEGRLAQIRDAGTVRFAEEVVAWPGVAPDARARVPFGAAPVIDGKLDDALWARALAVPARSADQPAFLLACDARTLYLGASFPSSLAERFRTPSTAHDAGGAVDGVKDGKYGFHSGQEPNPWWQVDLGAVTAIDRVVVFNRLDYAPGLHNADSIELLTSNDGAAWQLRHRNGGKFFGGVGSGEPLVVTLSDATTGGAKIPAHARFVRLRLPSATPIFFHLDEVEVYGPEVPEKNLALKKRAAQSSLSIWSRGGLAGGGLCALPGSALALDDEATSVLCAGVPLPAAQARVARNGEQTTVEVALPLPGDPPQFPASFAPPTGDPVAIAPGLACRVALAAETTLGFGKNVYAFTVELDGAAPVEVTLTTVVFTPRRPERRVVLTKTFERAERVRGEFALEGEGPAALLLQARQGAGELLDGRTAFIPPVADTLRRAELLLADAVLPATEKLRALAQRAAELAARELREGPAADARAALCREARWCAREVAFAHPKFGAKEIVFLTRTTQQTYPDVCLNHMPWCCPPGGDICILTRTSYDAPPVVRTLLGGALGPGHVRGLDLWWDADRIVFGYAKAASDKPPEGWLDRATSYALRRSQEPIHIFELALDGTPPRQLTKGEWSDLDPTYLPDGSIAFASERCAYSLQCNEYDKDETSCNLYRMKPDGSGIRRLTVTKDGDYMPHTLADGTICYTRWEYQERGWAHVQSPWFVRPDGTGADAIFKQHFNEPWALEDARSIPESAKLVAIATGHHTLPAGPVVLIDANFGINNPDGLRSVTPGLVPPEGGMIGLAVREGGVQGKGGFAMHPWPLSEKQFLAVRNYGAETEPAGYALYLLDVFGTMELLYRDPRFSCFTPIPLAPRPRPPVLPDRTEPDKDYAVVTVSDVAQGLTGVPRKAMRYIRVGQRLAWPYGNEQGGERYEPDVKSVMINWTPARVIGVVPIEADGSARFRVPVDKHIYFQLLDENFMELRRMRSFVSFQSGEERGCTGCHETRSEAPPNGKLPLAFLREPVIPTPPPWGDRAMSYLRDVQPILDRHCVACHGGLKPAGGLDFSGGLTASYNRSYDTIRARGLIARSNVGDDARVTQVLEFGSHKSKLIASLRNADGSLKYGMTRNEWLTLVTWVDLNGPYHDGFINKRQKEPPYDLPADAKLAAQILDVSARRCASCHAPADVARLDWIDLRSPRKSRFLVAPLAKSAGGTEKCGSAVYRDRDDPDYRALVATVTAAVNEAWRRPRRDLKVVKEEEGIAVAAEEGR